MATRVFITGIGAMTPVGNTRQEFWQSLVAGRSGIARLETIDVSDLPITIGGEVRGVDFTRADVNDKVSHRKMDRASIFAVLAAGEALADAGFQPGQSDLGENVAAVIGSGLSGLATLQQQTENLLSKGARGVSAFTIPILMPNAPPANISLAYGITGPCYSVASACSSSGHAMIDAFEMIRRGDVDVVVTGGTESSLTRLGISAFANMRAMTKKFNDRPQAACRPFELDRDGFIMSEGAAILVFESEESLSRRGGRAYAEMVGWGTTMDSYHLVQPDPSAKGAIAAMRKCLAMARWSPAEIAGHTYINAHGTGTKFNDLMETVAIKEVFGESARRVQISSTKSETGHMIGAACAAEMAASALALQAGVLPPTINYDTPDPECDLDYVPNEARPASAGFALNNSFGFGGHNVCLALKKV
ncbi:MAG TPA: beta-ketoacyl-ACP synthase II [Planctomycetaceae bacterium]|nr:beta-ketoacyl-ACP synthase II [Planctomycetaceae bacterium]